MGSGKNPIQSLGGTMTAAKMDRMMKEGWEQPTGSRMALWRSSPKPADNPEPQSK
jgi:hypothetical protein